MQHPGIILVWLQAARPKTLFAAVAPVLMGTAMAYADGSMHLPAALACLAGALLLQIGTNFSNDYADFVKGADTEERIGPVRATQAGLVSPGAMKTAAILTFVAAAAVCGYLVTRGGWPILALGILSILAGVAYTSGPYPLAYLGLGDLFVLIFFGPVAVAGTYYVQAQTFSWLPAAAGLAPGLLAVAILVVNNLRDIEGDRKAGKHTLAVRFGASFSRWQYTGCIVLAAAVPPLLIRFAGPGHVNAHVASLILLIAIPPIRMVFARSGRALNPLLGITSILLLTQSILFSIGWNL